MPFFIFLVRYNYYYYLLSFRYIQYVCKISCHGNDIKKELIQDSKHYVKLFWYNFLIGKYSFWDFWAKFNEIFGIIIFHAEINH